VKSVVRKERGETLVEKNKAKPLGREEIGVFWGETTKDTTTTEGNKKVNRESAMGRGGSATEVMIDGK